MSYRYQNYLENGVAHLAIPKTVKIAPSDVTSPKIFAAKPLSKVPDPANINKKIKLYQSSINIIPTYSKTISDEKNKNFVDGKTQLTVSRETLTKSVYSYDDKPKKALGNSIGKTLYNVGHKFFKF